MRDARHREIGRRFRQVAAKINWEKIRDSFLPIHEANQLMQEPAKLAGRQGAFTRDQKMDTIMAEANSQGGRVVRAVYDLYRQLNVDSDREYSNDQFKRQKTTILSADEIQELLGPKIGDVRFGEGLVRAMDTFLQRLGGLVGTRFQPVLQLALQYKNVCFSELKRLEVAGVCEECGQTFVMTSRRKRFCLPEFEDRDCGARARNRRWYKKHARPAMTRSESAQKAARARWSQRRDSTGKK